METEIKRLTKEDLKRYASMGYMTVKDMREAIEGLPDDGLILVQRVEDVYYQNNGWGVYLKEGEHYYSAVRLNENMNEEIDRRLKGEEPDYPMIDDPATYMSSAEDLEQSMDQYHPAWCAVKYKDDQENLFIDLHY